MANEYAVNLADLTAVADAIRAKGGTSGALSFPGGFVDAVRAIETGGGESGGASGWAYDMGEFVLSEEHTGGGGDEATVISHNLGVKPGYILVWTDDLTGTAIAEDKNDNLGFIYMRRLMNLPQRLSSAATGGLEQAITVNFYRTKADNLERVAVGAPTSTAYMYDESWLTENTFRLPQIGGTGNNTWRAGITYRYFCASAWWHIEEEST